MRIPIVTYHAIGEGPPPLWLPEKAFRSQIAALASAGFAGATVREAALALRTGATPERRVAITFDDAYAGVTKALPVLAEHGFTATLYVVSDFAGRDNGWPGQPARVPRSALLTWDEIAALAAAGWEIGSHGRSHASFVTLDDGAIEEEMNTSNAEIASRIGVDIDTLAFPYGDTDARVRRIAAKHYKAAVGTRLGLATEQSELLHLPRIDAYYLNEKLARSIDGRAAAGYFALRQMIRSVRSRVEAFSS